MSHEPSTTGDNGRSPKGTFLPGNKAARGNPHARRVARLRSALLKAVTPADIRRIVKSLIEAAAAGDTAAAKIVLDRTLGRPDAIDLLSRIEELETEQKL